MPAHRGVRDGGGGVPAVADGADGRAHHDPAPPVGQRHGAGGGDAGAGGAGLPSPLPGVEHDRGGGGAAGDAGFDGVDPPRPRSARCARAPRAPPPGRTAQTRQDMAVLGQVPGVLPVVERRSRPGRARMRACNARAAR